MSSIDKSLTSEQCRGGRGLLNWTQEDLAGRCNVSRATIATFESGAQIARNNHIAIRLFLEIVAEVEAKYGQILFLTDVTEGFGLSSESRRYTAEWSKQHRIVASAFFGASTPARAMLTLVMRAMSLLGNSQPNTRFFATEAEARDFLDQFRVPEFRRKG